MPPLHICGGTYSVLFAGDDLRIISIGAILIRLIQIGLLIPSFLLLLHQEHQQQELQLEQQQVSYDNDDEVDDHYYDEAYIWFVRNVLWIFWTLSMTTALFSIILEVIIFRISSRGNMVDEKKERTNLPIYCAIKLFPLSILRIVALISAIVALIYVKDYCHQSINADNNNNINNTNNNSQVTAITTTEDIEIPIPVEFICPRYNQTVLLITALGWIHIIEALVTFIMYLYVACQLAHHGSRKIQQYFMKRSAISAITTNAVSGGGGHCYWHWSLLCRCTCTITSLCTCCCFGGHEVIFRGDFTDIAMALTEFLDFGSKEQYYDLDSSSQLGSRQGNDNNNNNDEEEEDDDQSVNSRRRRQQQRRQNNQNQPLISVTTTDMLAGLLLVAEDQRVQRREQSLAIYIEQQRIIKSYDGEMQNTDINDLDTTNDKNGSLDHEEDIITSENDTVEVKFKDKVVVVPEQINTDLNDSIDDTTTNPKSIVRGLLLCRTSSDIDDEFDYSDHQIESQHYDDDDHHHENIEVPSEYYYEITERHCLSPEDAPLLQDAAHYLQLSMSIYGYLMYLYAGEKDNCCCSIFSWSRLCQRSIGKKCSYCCRTKKYHDHAIVEGDSCFSCNEVALVEMAGNGTSLVYASFRSGLRRCPYCILLDHPRQAIVIVVQGTFSLESAAADMSIRPANVWDEISQDPNNSALYESFVNDGATESNPLMGQYCHSGVLQCALKLHSDLSKHRKLEQLLLGEMAQYPSYKLVCTGHSLGGGVAAVLSILLESSIRKRGKELYCMCFCPPGCTMTKKLAEKEFITSFVMDSDIVPRLSLHALEGLRNNVLEMIARAKIPKHEIYYRNLFNTHHDKEMSPADSVVLRDQLLRRKSGLYDTTPIFHRRESIAQTEFSRQLKNYKKYQKKLRNERRTNLEEDVKLIIPGKRIVHLIKDRTITWEESDNTLLRPVRRRPKRVKQYTAIWAKADDFAEIQLSKSFMLDHFPDTFCDKLQIAADLLLSET